MFNNAVAKGAVGFTVSLGLDDSAAQRRTAARRRALRHFPWLHHAVVEQGVSSIELWSHDVTDGSLHQGHDGCLYMLVGSPVGRLAWSAVLAQLKRQGDDGFELPWEGRAVLIRVTPDGREWTMWNDWCGSIPVFHARVGQGRIAGTLEPVVVGAAGYTPSNFFRPAVISLLINGHYLNDWTLYEGMKVVPADCVAKWSDSGFQLSRLWTVKPTDTRWNHGWDDLVDEMHQLTQQAIADVLVTSPSWVLPLSGGLDSRLIAAVGAQMGTEMRAYTYGSALWNETIYARQVAKALKIPWKRIDLGTGYLARYTRTWADWFGSALHFHGMYQMPFLHAVRSQNSPIVTGFTGDPLAGAQTALMAPPAESLLDVFTRKWCMWSKADLRRLAGADVGEAIAEIEHELKRLYDETPGAHYQKIWMLFQWSHVFGFSYYQPMMYDYFSGVGTPYLNRQLARFALSLPRLAMERRRLQAAMVCRYYPKMAQIGGTHTVRPYMETGRFLVKTNLATRLPRWLMRGPLREFATTPNTLEGDCLKATGRASLWPIYDAWDSLAERFDTNELNRLLKKALAGDPDAHMKHLPIQTIAYRMLDFPSPTDQPVADRIDPVQAAAVRDLSGVGAD